MNITNLPNGHYQVRVQFDSQSTKQSILFVFLLKDDFQVNSLWDMEYFDILNDYVNTISAFPHRRDALQASTFTSLILLSIDLSLTYISVNSAITMQSISGYCV